MGRKPKNISDVERNIDDYDCYVHRKRSRTLIDLYCRYVANNKSMHCVDCVFYEDKMCFLCTYWNRHSDKEILEHIIEEVPNIFEILDINGIEELDEIIKENEIRKKFRGMAL